MIAELLTVNSQLIQRNRAMRVALAQDYNLQEDNMSDLKAITDEAVYKAMQKETPALVESITILLRAGETPVNIERRLRRTFGDVQMVRNARHVADYLLHAGSIGA